MENECPRRAAWPCDRARYHGIEDRHAAFGHFHHQRLGFGSVDVDLGQIALHLDRLDPGVTGVAVDVKSVCHIGRVLVVQADLPCAALLNNTKTINEWDEQITPEQTDLSKK